MPLISFYSVDTEDEKRFRKLLPSGNQYEFTNEPINTQNLNSKSEGIAIFVRDEVSREILDKLPELKFIACRATGFNNIDQVAAAEKNVAILTVPSYGEKTVAEFTFALLLSLSRRVAACANAAITGAINRDELSGFDLSSKTLGIVGAGRIGRNVARIAKGFGMTVLAFDPYPNQAEAQKIGYQHVGLDELTAKSDVISLHAPATEQNYHLVNDRFLAHVRPGVIILNTARGELIDTFSLLKALQDGRVAGAGLDVIEHEELLNPNQEVDFIQRAAPSGEEIQAIMAINALKAMPNVVLTPHNAYNTSEAKERIRQTTAQNIIDFYRGQMPNKVKEPMEKTGQLLITRHCESEWNALGKWTGTTDVHLSENGFKQAAIMGEALKDIKVDYAFASQQIRTLETLQGILDASSQIEVPYQRSSDINERDYGDYTGMNKWEVRDKVGEEEFNSIRRDWDHPIPNGETLKIVYERAVPFYQQVILPMLLDGKTVLVVSHGNSIRSLIKYLEDISDQDIAHVEMPFGTILDYRVNEQGKMTGKSQMNIELAAPPA